MIKVRETKRPNVTGTLGEMNIHGIGEVIVYYDGDDGGADSVFEKDLDVLVEGSIWKSFRQACLDKDIIHNNHNTHYRVATEEDKIRGYALW